MAINTHYVRRDLSPAGWTAEELYRRMVPGGRFFVLYEPNEFDADWRLVWFKVVEVRNRRTGEKDRMLVVIEEWGFDSDPRTKIA